MVSFTLENCDWCCSGCTDCEALKTCLGAVDDVVNLDVEVVLSGFELLSTCTNCHTQLNNTFIFSGPFPIQYGPSSQECYIAGHQSVLLCAGGNLSSYDVAFYIGGVRRGFPVPQPIDAVLVEIDHIAGPFNPSGFTQFYSPINCGEICSGGAVSMGASAVHLCGVGNDPSCVLTIS